MKPVPTFWTGLVLAAAFVAAGDAHARNTELDARARRAGEVFRELRTAPDNGIPEDLIARSQCIAVVPSLVRAAWFVGGHYGKGVLACRTERGDWSPPVHVMLTGGGFGLQFGASSTDIAMNAEIYSYARARGLFAGVSIDGGYLGVDGDDTRAFYGRNYGAQTILFEDEITSIPRSAWEFLGALPQGGAAMAAGERTLAQEPRF